MPLPGFYHCIVSTYGSWLPGDPRGWRSRHHRVHVDGDYRNPPPLGMHDDVLCRSRALMKRPEVVLSSPQQSVVRAAFSEKLVQLGCDVLELVVLPRHLHVLLRMLGKPQVIMKSPGMAMPGLSNVPTLWNGQTVRNLLGLAKKHSSHVLRQHGLTTHPGGIWAVGSKIVPVRDQSHLNNVISYIRAHKRDTS